MERISLKQLAAMIVLFEIGTSPLFLLAADAKEDAWISVLVALACGTVLLYVVTIHIQKLEPDKNLIEICLAYLGKPIGLLVSWIYVLFFLYESVRNVRETGDLLNQYLLPQSPLYFVSGIILLISVYSVYAGIEVCFRVAEALLPVIGFIYLLIMGLFVVVGLVNIHELQPVLGSGVKPVLSAALPEVISFPFGEMIVFLMFWKHTADRKKTYSVTMEAFLAAGLFLVFTNALMIAMLGEKLAGAGGIPLLLAASTIQIAHVIERMDPLVAILLFLGVQFKQTLFYLAGVLALATIFKTSYKKMILPAGITIYASAMMFRSLMQHINIGFKWNVKYDYPVYEIVLPIVLLAVMKIRKAVRRPEGGNQHEASESKTFEEAPTGEQRQNANQQAAPAADGRP